MKKIFSVAMTSILIMSMAVSQNQSKPALKKAQQIGTQQVKRVLQPKTKAAEAKVAKAKSEIQKTRKKLKIK